MGRGAGTAGSGAPAPTPARAAGLGRSVGGARRAVTAEAAVGTRRRAAIPLTNLLRARVASAGLLEEAGWAGASAAALAPECKDELVSARGLPELPLTVRLFPSPLLSLLPLSALLRSLLPIVLWLPLPSLVVVLLLLLLLPPALVGWGVCGGGEAGERGEGGEGGTSLMGEDGCGRPGEGG